MYHPFKQLETAWNSRVPVYMQNGTKENLLAQLALVVVFLGAYFAYDEYKVRKEERELELKYPEIKSD